MRGAGCKETCLSGSERGLMGNHGSTLLMLLLLSIKMETHVEHVYLDLLHVNYVIKISQKLFLLHQK